MVVLIFELMGGGGLVLSVDGMCCWPATLGSTNCFTARLNKCFGHLSFKNTVSNRSHSRGKYDQSEDMP